MVYKLTVKQRYCGPSRSGNGGYVCGLVAKGLIETHEVRLMSPPPLDIGLLLRTEKNAAVLTHGDQIVAHTRVCEWDLEPPSIPNFDDAVLAQKSYTGFVEPDLPLCFVCGPDRKEGDGLRIFAGKLQNGGECVSAPWHVSADLPNEDGVIFEEFIWAALDCPGYFAIQERAGFALLGSFSAKIKRQVRVGEQLIVVGWPVSAEGRKNIAGTALIDQQGHVVATAKAVWITVREEAIEQHI